MSDLSYMAVIIISMIVGIIISGKIDKHTMKEEFNRGYELAVDQITNYGYWYDDKHGRHEGEWHETKRNN